MYDLSVGSKSRKYFITLCEYMEFQFPLEDHQQENDDHSTIPADVAFFVNLLSVSVFPKTDGELIGLWGRWISIGNNENLREEVFQYMESAFGISELDYMGFLYGASVRKVR